MKILEMSGERSVEGVKKHMIETSFTSFSSLKPALC